MKTTLLVLLTSALALNAQAGSATWKLNPVSGDWNTAANWSPATVPNGAADNATFGVSNLTAVDLSADTAVSSAIFNAGASAFTITNPGLNLTIDGPGVINHSGVVQNFVCNSFSVSQGGLIAFTGNASAGSQNTYTSNGVPGGHSSSISFFDNATAGSASFVAHGSSLSNVAGLVDFFGSATAATGDFTLYGSTTGAGAGGTVTFHGQSSAGSASFTTFGGVFGSEGGGRGGAVLFADMATAANCTVTNHSVLPGGNTAGITSFAGTATAGNATMTNEGGTAGAPSGGLTVFYDSASAGDAVITNVGGDGDFIGAGRTQFYYGGGGGNATFINNPGKTRDADGGTTEFGADSSAGNATLLANSATENGNVNGGQIVFPYNSDGGTCRIILFGNGTLFVASHDDDLPITVGSVEGDGRITLGYRDLVVGSNNLSTTYSGRINGLGGDGTITKIGRGSWTVTGDNAYSAGTYINGGTLVANNRAGSATGTGLVQVNIGTLAGRGILAGPVTVGSGRGRAAEISPGARAARNVGALTLQRGLNFSSDGCYSFQINSNDGLADKLVADGVAIDGAALFKASDLGSSALSLGTSFLAIDNTAATPISGAFGNLPDDATVTIGSNHFQASYSGGDGNDLTLTVVP